MNEEKKKESYVEWQLENYLPDEEQLIYASELLTITSQCEKQDINYAVGGGYGLDGLYGKLTRAHGDIDMLVKDEDIHRFELLLESLGYSKYEGDSDKNKTVFKNPNLPTDFKVEFASDKLLTEYEQKDIGAFFPHIPNASIGDRKFRCIPLNEAKQLVEIQNIRAKEQVWRDYPDEKKLNQLAILEALSL